MFSKKFLKARLVMLLISIVLYLLINAGTMISAIKAGDTPDIIIIAAMLPLYIIVGDIFIRVVMNVIRLFKPKRKDKKDDTQEINIQK